MVLEGAVTGLHERVCYIPDEPCQSYFVEVGNRVIYPGNSGGALVNDEDEVIGFEHGFPSCDQTCCQERVLRNAFSETRSQIVRERYFQL